MSKYGRRGPYRCFFRHWQNQRPRQGVRLSSLRKQSDSGQFLGDHLGEAPEPPIDRFHREASHSRQERLRSSLRALKLLQFAQVVLLFLAHPPLPGLWLARMAAFCAGGGAGSLGRVTVALVCWHRGGGAGQARARLWRWCWGGQLGVRIRGRWRAGCWTCVFWFGVCGCVRVGLGRVRA